VTPHRIAGAGEADVEVLAHLDAACFDSPWSPSDFLAVLAGGVSRAWRLDVAGEPVAYAVVRVVAGEGELLRMGVRPGHRRQHLAATLLRAILTEVGPVVPHGLHLEVRAGNAPARALYVQQGFVESGRRRGYYAAPGDDAVLLRWQPARADERP
jgi:[ribosomal protein S18]-alanine N-acetyltransferase